MRLLDRLLIERAEEQTRAKGARIWEAHPLSFSMRRCVRCRRKSRPCPRCAKEKVQT